MRRTFAAAVGAVAAAAVLSGTGLAAASASPAASGTERFQLMSTSATSNKISAIFTGTFTAGTMKLRIRRPATPMTGSSCGRKPSARPSRST